MKNYPPLVTDPAAYRDAIACVVSDPFRQRIVEALWHGTRDYQKFITRDGLEVQQKLLRDIRFEIGRINDSLPRLAGANAASETKAAEQRDRANSLCARRDSHRFARSIDSYRRDALALEQKVSQNKAYMRRVKDALPKYKEAADRLEAALVLFVTDPPKRDEAAPPQITVNVEAPSAAPAGPIAVEVVSMPARQTTTEIERNAAGEIVSSHQVESDF